MFQRILIAIEPEASADAAVHAGIRLAGSMGARRVALISVIPPPPPLIANLAAEDRSADEHRHAARRLLAQYRGWLPEETEVEQMVTAGLAGEEIVEAARAWHADLVVVGTHDRHGLQKFLLGSTAEKVVRQAPCSVMVVRPNDAPPSPAG